MKTEILPPEMIDRALFFLRNEEPVVFPTETVYGLGASALDSKSIQKIFDIKGRPSDNPLIVHISNLTQLSYLSDEIPPSFFALAKAFWPGPLTLIVKRKSSVPALVSASHPTIGIRMPSHPVALKLIDLFGSPLAAPSANLSGKPSPTSVVDVLEDLEGRVSAIIDGGNCLEGIESTVLNLSSEFPMLLRPGSISQAQLEEVLKQKVLLSGKDTPTLSPGMKYRHYAPKAKLRLIFDQSESKGAYLLSEISRANLYSSLRQVDRMGISEVEILCDQKTLQDVALMNRLLKASGNI